MRAAKKELLRLISLLTTFCFLTACASSEVQRNAASNVDLGVQNAKNLVSEAGDGSIGDSYQNTSQTTKGILLGGTAGAITGTLTTGVGFFPGTVAGAILGGSYGAYIDSNSTLDDQLENRGATVIVLGDQILMVIPSSRIFQPLTATVKNQAYSTLRLIAQFVNQYTKTLVKLSVYTADTGSKSEDLGLSQEQAESVAKILLGYGIDARLLYAVGYGGTHLVQKNSFMWDGSENYRIEITLEKIYE